MDDFLCPLDTASCLPIMFEIRNAPLTTTIRTAGRRGNARSLIE